MQILFNYLVFLTFYAHHQDAFLPALSCAVHILPALHACPRLGLADYCIQTKPAVHDPATLPKYHQYRACASLIVQGRVPT